MSQATLHWGCTQGFTVIPVMMHPRGLQLGLQFVPRPSMDEGIPFKAPLSAAVPQENRSSPRPWPVGDGNAGLCASVSPLIDQVWCQHLGDGQGNCQAGLPSVGGCCGGPPPQRVSCPSCHAKLSKVKPCPQTEPCPCASPADSANAVALGTPIAFRRNLHTRAFPMHPITLGHLQTL